MRPHLSLNVSNLARSVAFYERVFGTPPQKRSMDYAKFDLVSPGLNLAMHEVSDPARVSRVGHLGIEVDGPEDVSAWQRRLEAAGIAVSPEEKTDCCYARQDKVWFEDPDGRHWEIFFVHEQLPVAEKSGCC